MGVRGGGALKGWDPKGEGPKGVGARWAGPKGARNGRTPKGAWPRGPPNFRFPLGPALPSVSSPPPKDPPQALPPPKSPPPPAPPSPRTVAPGPARHPPAARGQQQQQRQHRPCRHGPQVTSLLCDEAPPGGVRQVRGQVSSHTPRLLPRRGVGHAPFVCMWRGKERRENAGDDEADRGYGVQGSVGAVRPYRGYRAV